MMQLQSNNFQVAIIGGSYAGLSAALALGRAIRTVLVIDTGKPCNTTVLHAHNILTHDGVSPTQIRANAIKDISKYDTVTLISDTAAHIESQDGHFVISTSSDQQFHCQKILIATGIKDLIPDIPGFNECWGISIAACPFCHGYEYNGLPTGILMSPSANMEYINTISQWSNNISVFTNNLDTLTDKDLEQFADRGIHVYNDEVVGIIHHQGNITEVKCDNNQTIPVQMLYHRPMWQLPSFVNQLSLSTTPLHLIEVDAMLSTNVYGVYAAGDCASPFRSLSNAIAMGSLAGAAINRELSEWR